MNRPIAGQQPAQKILSPEKGFDFQPDQGELGVVNSIQGHDIESKLVDLASIGGEPKEATENLPNRYGTNRLALSDHDHAARSQFIRPKMAEAGMEVYEHPLADIGVYPGQDSDLEPLVIMSHTDTVPNGDMYDGTTGVIGGIEVVKAINESGLKPKRDIMVVSLTGEESSRFNFALFGSRALFQGLTHDELEAADKDGVRLVDTLDEEQKKIVGSPFFGNQKDFKKPAAVVELHVEQFDSLAETGTDIGVVNSIAAPVRYSVSIGETSLEPEKESPRNPRYLQLRIVGKPDHSGATPMGPESRADALVESAKYISGAIDLVSESGQVEININDIDLTEGQAINKIPGDAYTLIRLSGSDPDIVDEMIQKLVHQATKHNEDLSSQNGKFGLNPVEIEEVNEPAQRFFDGAKLMPRVKATTDLIVAVNKLGIKQKAEKVVATVGTLKISEQGVIKLGLDIRGKNLIQRDRCEYLIKQRGHILKKIADISFGNPLAGSGEPVEMNPELVEVALNEIERFEIGSSTVMFSPAGHDAQNAARADIPTVMLFCPSHEGAHNPNAFSTPAELEKGVKALAAITLKLSSR